jgi:hypothetical protein
MVKLARFHNEVKLYGLEGWASFMLETLDEMLTTKKRLKYATFRFRSCVINFYQLTTIIDVEYDII